MADDVQTEASVEAGEAAAAAAAANAQADQGGQQAEPQAQEGGENPPPKPEGEKKSPWFLQRISEESAARREAADRAAAAERRASDAEAMLARIQAGEKPPVQQERQQPRSEAQPQRDGDFQANVRAEAARMRLYDDSQNVKTIGMSKFTNFGESLNILTAVGATSDDFVSDLIAVDKANAHVLIDKLAKDPEKAAMLAKMDTRSRTAELTRMAMSEQQQPKPAAEQPKPVAVSKAPPPKPVFDAAGAGPDNWDDDDATDEQFMQGWKKKYGMR